MRAGFRIARYKDTTATACDKFRILSYYCELALFSHIHTTSRSLSEFLALMFASPYNLMRAYFNVYYVDAEPICNDFGILCTFRCGWIFITNMTRWWYPIRMAMVLGMTMMVAAMHHSKRKPYKSETCWNGGASTTCRRPTQLRRRRRRRPCSTARTAGRVVKVSNRINSSRITINSSNSNSSICRSIPTIYWSSCAGSAVGWSSSCGICTASPG